MLTATSENKASKPILSMRCTSLVYSGGSRSYWTLDPVSISNSLYSVAWFAASAPTCPPKAGCLGFRIHRNLGVYVKENLRVSASVEALTCLRVSLPCPDLLRCQHPRFQKRNVGHPLVTRLPSGHSLFPKNTSSRRRPCFVIALDDVHKSIRKPEERAL